MLTSSIAYTQPFGSDGFLNPKSFGNDSGNLFSVVTGRRNCSGIFIVFKGIEEATCQRCGLCTIEVNPCHAVGLNGAPHCKSRWEVECGIGYEGSMAVAVFSLFPTASTASEIIVGG
jgi:hypothetical protein